MKKLLLSAFLVSSFAASAQVTVFSDGFETYEDFAITGFGGWLTFDLDGLPVYSVGDEFEWPNIGEPQAWQIFNPSATTPPVTNSTAACSSTDENRNFDPHGGAKYVGSWAAVPSETGGPTANNDYLISPVIQLGESNNQVSLWAKALSSCYGIENFQVLVYVGTGVPASPAELTLISGLPNPIATALTWTQRTYSLNAYSNQSIRLAIRNMNSDRYFLMIDDITVTSSNLKVDEVFSSKFTVYPNPSNGVINLSNADNIFMTDLNITDINGRIVKSINLNGVSETQVNISDLSNGVYMLNIHSAEGKAVKKIVKQ